MDEKKIKDFISALINTINEDNKPLISRIENIEKKLEEIGRILNG